MSGSGKSGLSQNNFTRFFVPINLLFSNCQVASIFLISSISYLLIIAHGLIIIPASTIIFMGLKLITLMLVKQAERLVLDLKIVKIASDELEKYIDSMTKNA